MFPLKKFRLLYPSLILILLVSIFFIRLFFPPSLFSTPDYGLSDLLHFNLPLKIALSENYKTLKLPLWEDRIGQGYPLFADGFVGALYVPNLLTFSILPINLALPSIYIITFSIAAISMFILLKYLKISNLPSILGSIAFTFSAALVLRVQHLNVLEATSILPLALLSYLIFTEKLEFKKMLFCSLILSQLFMTGYLQIFVYSFLIFFILGILFQVNKKKRQIIKFLSLFILLSLITLLLSSIQLLPSYELASRTNRGEELSASQILYSFPISFKNLLSFFNPFLLGNASNGTYNSLEWSKFGIFWESTAYIGLIPFIFTLFAVIFFIKSPKEFNYLKVFIVIFIITILLALGKNSPLLIIYSFPPLNYFRVPSRFLIFSQIFAVILASYALQIVFSKFKPRLSRFFLILLIILTLIDLWTKWWNYNPIESYSLIAKKPPAADQLDLENNNYRLYSLFPTKNWNEIFTKYGWNNKQDYYKFFLNSLDPNLNILYDLNGFSVYSAQRPKRMTIQETILQNNIKRNPNDAQTNTLAEKILSQASVKYLISTVPIDSTNYKKINEITKDDFKYLIYQGENVNKRVTFYYDYVIVDSTTYYDQKISEIETDKTVILEENIGEKFDMGNYEILQTSYSPTKIEITASTDKKGLLVLSDSYYPGWKATVDSKPAKVIAANINSRAIIFPEGEHKVNFSFSPFSLKIGFLLTLVAYCFLIPLLFFDSHKILKAFKIFRNSFKVFRLFQKIF